MCHEVDSHFVQCWLLVPGNDAIPEAFSLVDDRVGDIDHLAVAEWTVCHFTEFN